MPLLVLCGGREEGCGQMGSSAAPHLTTAAGKWAVNWSVVMVSCLPRPLQAPAQPDPRGKGGRESLVIVGPSVRKLSLDLKQRNIIRR